MAAPLAFVTVVVVVRNQANELEAALGSLVAALGAQAADYEIVVVDNASEDASLERLKALTAEAGLPNLSVFALTTVVDSDTATWMGLDSALGDFVVVFDLRRDSPEALAPLLEAAGSGADIVFATNPLAKREPLVHQMLGTCFGWMYALFHGSRFVRDAPALRLLSRAAVLLILKHPQPSVTYRQLAQLAGFQRAHIEVASPPRHPHAPPLAARLDRGIRLLITTTRAPLRSVTWLATVAAALNMLYSVYVVAVFMLKDDVAPGWTTLSLQTSGMFLLVSLILMMLGEHVLQLATSIKSGAPWQVAREWTSARTSRRRGLNVVEGPTSDVSGPGGG